jgi:hypothetical protein
MSVSGTCTAIVTNFPSVGIIAKSVIPGRTSEAIKASEGKWLPNKTPISNQ